MEHSETTLSTRRIHEGRIINLREDVVRLADGRESKREIVEHKGAVCIVPVLPDGRIVMVRQFRKPAEAALLEVPAGGLESGEEPLEAARRELIEECGYEAARITPLFQAYLAPGYSTELMYAFLGEELTTCDIDPDEDENVEVEIYTLDELLTRIDKGEVSDAKTLSALLCLYRRRMEAK